MQITIKDFFGLILKKIWLIVSVTLIFGVIGFSVSKFVISKKYTSQVAFLVSYTSQESSSSSTANNDLTYSQKVVGNCVVVLSQNLYYETLANQLNAQGIAVTADQVSGMLVFTRNTDTSTFIVTVTNSDAEIAHEIALLIKTTAPEYIVEMYPQPGTNTILIKGINEPKEANSPISPNVPLYTLLALIVGAVLSIFACLVIELSDNRIRSEESLQTKFSYPVLGVIPRIGMDENQKK